MSALRRRLLIFAIGIIIGFVVGNGLVGIVWQSFMPKKAEDMCIIGILSVALVLLSVLLLFPEQAE